MDLYGESDVFSYINRSESDIFGSALCQWCSGGIFGRNFVVDNSKLGREIDGFGKEKKKCKINYVVFDFVFGFVFWRNKQNRGEIIYDFPGKYWGSS